jgi:hypothetical protein
VSEHSRKKNAGAIMSADTNRQKQLWPDATIAPRFTGWLREAGSTGSTRWRRVVEADSWGAAWYALLRVESKAISYEKVVRRGDSHPDARRSPR